MHGVCLGHQLPGRLLSPLPYWRQRPWHAHTAYQVHWADERDCCRADVLLPRDIEVMDEDRLQGLREKPRPSAQLPDSDDEAELLRLQASLPDHSVTASTFCACCFRATILRVDALYAEVTGDHWWHLCFVDDCVRFADVRF